MAATSEAKTMIKTKTRKPRLTAAERAASDEAKALQKKQLAAYKAEKVTAITATGVKRTTRHKAMLEAKAARQVVDKAARQKRNNETLISLRIERESVAAFEAMLAEAQAVAAEKSARAPTRSAVARAALAYMLSTAKTKKDRAAWITDILAAA